MRAHHANKTLAESGACTVEHCPECDVVHVHFGHASVRLRPAAFQAACHTLMLAVERLAQIEAASACARPGRVSCH
jgi:hypothetical protein